jgi:hypothetical protein
MLHLFSSLMTLATETAEKAKPENGEQAIEALFVLMRIFILPAMDAAVWLESVTPIPDVVWLVFLIWSEFALLFFVLYNLMALLIPSKEYMSVGEAYAQVILMVVIIITINTVFSDD